GRGRSRQPGGKSERRIASSLERSLLRRVYRRDLGLRFAAMTPALSLIGFALEALESRNRPPAQVRSIEAHDLCGRKVGVLRAAELHECEHLLGHADRATLEPQMGLMA